MSETQGGIQYNAIRLTWSAPSCGGAAVDSYTVKYSTSGAINDGNWAGATTASSVDYADGGTPRAPTVTETCTVNGLSENISYYFAIQSTKSGTPSLTSNSPSATPLQSSLGVGDWWLWNFRYNSYGIGQSYKNHCYQLDFVDAINQSVNDRYWNGSNFTVTNTARIENNLDYQHANNANWALGRGRIVGAPTVTNAGNVMWDICAWVKGNDPTVYVRQDQMAEVFWNSLGMGYGMAPSNSYYTYNTSVNGSYAGQYRDTDGYPDNASEQTWRADIYNTAWAQIVGLTQQYWRFDFKVVASNASYDLTTISDPDGNSSDYASSAFAPNSSYFTWYRTNNQSQHSEPNCKNASALSRMWYSPQVHNLVRHIDYLAYKGWEDQVLLGYEARDFGRSTLSVTGWNGSSLSVSMKVTNNCSDVTQNYSVICCLLNLSAKTRVGTNDSPFYYGECVYPNMHTPNSSSWPQFNVIKYTGNLAPGANTTVSWTIPYATSPSYNWAIWCSGLTNVSNPGSPYP